MLKTLRKRQSDSADPQQYLTEIVSKASLMYVDALPQQRYPRDEELRNASISTGDLIREDLEQRWTAEAPAGAGVEQMALMRLDFANWATDFPLCIPAPPLVAELSGWKLALAAIIGTILGGLLLSGLFNLLMDQSVVGMLIGGPLGAAAVILALFYAAENPKLRYTLQALLGAASIGELWLAFGTLGMGGIWTAITGVAGAGMLGMLRRIGLYIGVFFFLKMGVRTPVYNRTEYRKLAEPFVELWLRSADIYLQLQHQRLIPRAVAPAKPADGLTELGSYLHKLHQSKSELLPEVAAELLGRARNLGVEGLLSTPVFLGGTPLENAGLIWKEELAEQFNCIGAIEEGDAVFVEEQALVRDGIVIEKGVVRKVRKR